MKDCPWPNETFHWRVWHYTQWLMWQCLRFIIKVVTTSQATASSGGPIPGSMSKYATPRFTNLLNRFRQLSSTRPFRKNSSNNDFDQATSPKIPPMLDVMGTSMNSDPTHQDELGKLMPPALEKPLILQQVGMSRDPPYPVTHDGMTSPMVDATQPQAEQNIDMSHPPSTVNFSILTTATAGLSPPASPVKANQPVPPAVENANGGSSHPTPPLTRMQTRKGKAEEEPFVAKKRVTKPANKLPPMVTKSSKTTKGKKPEAPSGNLPKRGCGRPRKNAALLFPVCFDFLGMLTLVTIFGNAHRRCKHYSKTFNNSLHYIYSLVPCLSSFSGYISMSYYFWKCAQTMSMAP